MKIKRGKGGSVELSNKTGALTLMYDAASGIIMRVTSKDQDVPISIPGEYEYSGIGITAIETATEVHLGKIELVRGAIDGVTVLFVPKDLQITKKIKDEMGNAEVLVVQSITSKHLGELIDAFNSEIVVLNPAQSEEFEKLTQAIKKEYGIDTIAQESTVNVDEKDFDSEEDNPVQFLQLQ